MYLQQRRAARAGRVWPEPEPVTPTPPKRAPKPTKKGPPRRTFRVAEAADMALVKRLLSACSMPVAELDVDPRTVPRQCVVAELGGVIVGAAVLDKHGDVGVLRAFAIEQRLRRERHGTALGAHVIRRADDGGLAMVYPVAATPWFIEELGFQHIERILLPRPVLTLPGIMSAPTSACIFEITPSVSGTRTPRRMAPRTLSEILAAPDPVDAEKAGPRGKRKRQPVRKDVRDDGPTATR